MDEDQGILDVGTLQHYLKGTNFPAQREVASNAESNGATQDLVSQIRNADAEQFNSKTFLPRRKPSSNDNKTFGFSVILRESAPPDVAFRILGNI